MRNLRHTVLHHALNTVLLMGIHQFSHAGLLGNSVAFARIAAYELD